jgi:hypothetical protein
MAKLKKHDLARDQRLSNSMTHDGIQWNAVSCNPFLPWFWPYFAFFDKLYASIWVMVLTYLISVMRHVCEYFCFFVGPSTFGVRGQTSWKIVISNTSTGKKGRTDNSLKTFGFLRVFFWFKGAKRIVWEVVCRFRFFSDGNCVCIRFTVNSDWYQRTDLFKTKSHGLSIAETKQEYNRTMRLEWITMA